MVGIKMALALLLALCATMQHASGDTLEDKCIVGDAADKWRLREGSASAHDDNKPGGGCAVVFGAVITWESGARMEKDGLESHEDYEYSMVGDQYQSGATGWCYKNTETCVVDHVNLVTNAGADKRSLPWGRPEDAASFHPSVGKGTCVDNDSADSKCAKGSAYVLEELDGRFCMARDAKIERLDGKEMKPASIGQDCKRPTPTTPASIRRTLARPAHLSTTESTFRGTKTTR
ncbi:unnamed protein product [Vitrella brassicaformis CCMP3155]|uniref:Uncharacterized protein n=1 Tax=Vitrella brassicaformis (strain CCMP3155) TaxID=1169540 RepID=A0A0G4F1Z6_VITBC|nr:unnamed protein product [Vitrella brassicaformis CCMP3155]|mmetsp:Transcript_15285/g.36364  ORF Transcript_15285/g.36364 Transcript_15285/m.36364 type:complete len:233 (-) Transcript_15285:1941-2639(-)|eukprot:CEM05773.1 unnamed protein product [Vitrella brassicaformis CCMP3155]